VRVLNDEVIERLGLSRMVVDAVADREGQVLTELERRYRDDRPGPDVQGRTVILVDDGLATGSTMRAAVDALRRMGPRRIVVAVPVGSRDVCESLAPMADEVVCVAEPVWFQAVSLWYEDFRQTTDEEVSALLVQALGCLSERPEELRRGGQEVALALPDAVLSGTLSLPADPLGLVVFAHGSGSSRHSPRNRQVARGMYESGFATLLFDLLTAEEEQSEMMTRHLRFDIGLLAGRLRGATEWIRAQNALASLPLGYFGASTGAAAALIAAADLKEVVRAVVSRGGRPDLAGPRLAEVQSAVLLLVGGNDLAVVELNRQAYRQLAGEKEMIIVPGASHLFEEPGALEEVTRLASAWFRRHLT
jgi:putative phosphoribosyl transferase